MITQIIAAAPWLIPFIAVGGIVGMGWKYIKLMWSRVTSIIIVSAVFEDDLAYEAMIHFWTNFKAIPMNPRRFCGLHLYVRSLRLAQLVAMENTSGTGLLFWRGWRPIWVTPASKKDEGANSPDVSESKITITFIRGTFKLSQLLLDVCDEANEYYRQSTREEEKLKINRFFVVTKSGCRGRLPNTDNEATVEGLKKSYSHGYDRYTRARRPIGYAWSQLGEQPDKDDPSPFEFLAFPKTVMKLVDDLVHWIASQKWYADRRIPWGWGILSTGPPGSGKSSLIRAVGEHLGIPVYFFDLASMTNEDFINAWASASYSSPCIIAFEDFETVFCGRKNITAEKGGSTLPLTFGCLLNRISGITRSDGIILFITSNDASTLDPAMCDTNLDQPSRPGRIDTRLILDGIDEECRTRVAKVVLSDDLEYVSALVRAGKDDQPSQFHNRCARVAQALYWARREGTEIDAAVLALLTGNPVGEIKQISIETQCKDLHSLSRLERED